MPIFKDFTLVAPSGIEVVLRDTGAAISKVMTPDRHGEFANIALPPQKPDDPCYAGSMLAPYAGRIANGRFEIDGISYQLTCNDGRNQCHGGFNNFSIAKWSCDSVRETADYQQVTFSVDAEDGRDGFPGNRHFTATYRLWNDDRLELTMTAETDRPTYVNLSNHVYWNLSGDFTRTMYDHYLQIHANEVYFNDKEYLMASRGPASPALDFSQARPIGRFLDDPQLETAKGLNHFYVLTNNGPAASLFHKDSGRLLQLFTDHPCLLIYSGGLLPVPNCAVAMEAEGHPLCPFAENQPLRPGQQYRRTITFKFQTVSTDN